MSLLILIIYEYGVCCLASPKLFSFLKLVLVKEYVHYARAACCLCKRGGAFLLLPEDKTPLRRVRVCGEFIGWALLFSDWLVPLNLRALAPAASGKTMLQG